MTQKPTRSVFVIMPFVEVEGGARNEERLTAFFANHIKAPIESATELEYRYVVSRSGEAFNITREIIRDLCRADVVIADLSGVRPNANVMYELGVRLAVSEKPVVLIKEDMPESTNPFDVFAYYTKPYDPLDYRPLEEHLVAKLARLESGEEVFDNEVRRLILEELALLTPDPRSIPPDQQRRLVLTGMGMLADVATTAFGPHGLGLRVRGGPGGGRLVTQGVDLGDHVVSDNPFEQEGVQILADAAREMASQVQDGSKLVMLISHGMIDAIGDSMGATTPSDGAREIEHVAEWVRGRLKRDVSGIDEERLNDIAATAAKVAEFPLDMIEIFRVVGAKGLIAVEESEQTETDWILAEHYQVDRGAVHEEFLTEENGTRGVLEDALVLLCSEQLSSMNELLPIIEQVAGSGRPLLLIAGRLEGEALATLRVNTQRGTLKCIPVSLPAAGHGEAIMRDIAVLTAAQLITPAMGLRLENATIGDLGSAQRIVVTRDSTQIFEGAGTVEAVETHIEHLRANVETQPSDVARDRVLERIARLAGKHVTVRIGAEGADARRAMRRIILEGIASCTAAMQHGMVAGMCSRLTEIGKELERGEGPSNAECGRRIVAAGLMAPLKALVTNAGDSSEEVTDQVKEGVVYNARERSIEGKEQTRLLDPNVIGVRAVGAAASLATDFLKTGAWNPPTEREPRDVIGGVRGNFG